MIEIRKLFKFEMAHVVRNAWSQRCAHSIHGHSYTAEIFLKGDKLDSAGMVLDFGLLKKFLHPFIDSFDHATWLWSADDPSILELFQKKFARVIISPFTSSAEVQALTFYEVTVRLLHTLRSHPELALDYMTKEELRQLDRVEVSSVIVHETATGYAQVRSRSFENEDAHQMYFSEDIISEWPEHFLKLFKSAFPLWQNKVITENK